LAINLKLFAQFVHLRDYFLKRKLLKRKLLCKCATQIA